MNRRDTLCGKHMENQKALLIRANQSLGKDSNPDTVGNVIIMNSLAMHGNHKYDCT